MVAAGRGATVAPRSEEAGALVTAVLAVTASGGAVVAAFQVSADVTPVIAVPTAVVVGALAVGREALALWSGVVVWLILVPMAPGTGVIAPLLMAGLCAVMVLGADRMLAWIGRDWAGHRPERDPADGWVEEMDPCATTKH